MFLILVNADAPPLAVIQNANIDNHLSDNVLHIVTMTAKLAHHVRLRQPSTICSLNSDRVYALNDASPVQEHMCNIMYSLCGVRVDLFAGCFRDSVPRLNVNGTANSRFRNPHCIFMADHMVLNQATGIIFCPGATSKTSRSCRALF